MLAFILWYLTATLVGLVAFLLAFRLFPALADRGYSLSRTLGLLLWGYLFWFLASIGLIPNSVGSLYLALTLLLGLGVWTYRKGWPGELRSWWQSHKAFVLTSEALFLLAFGLWALVRSANPEAVGTEKPMELAFINAILGSSTFPPHDPWLSGYAISYYYFGYVIVAMLAKFTGVPGAVAFNLGISLVFGLTALGAYGLVYNLLMSKPRLASQPEAEEVRPVQAIFGSLLGPLFVLIVSNLEGFLHMLHTRGLFWSKDASGQWTSSFWKWLDIVDLNVPPSEPFSWVPNKFWWWWRASRVIQDKDLVNGPREIIDEFPFFSYLLSDLHPHVLAMPFALLAIGLALNLFLGGSEGRLDWLRRRFNLRTLTWIGSLSLIGGFGLLWVSSQNFTLRGMVVGAAGLLVGWLVLMRIGPQISRYGAALFFRSDLEDEVIGQPLCLNNASFWLASVILGGMAFLNTWDFPVYVALFAGAYTLWRIRLEGLTWDRFKEFVLLGVALGLSGVLLYLPFYIGFSSQAGGIIPNLIFATRGAHLWVMFGTLFLPLFAYLVYLTAGQQDRRSFLLKGFGLAAGLVAVLWLLSLVLGFGISAIPEASTAFLSTQAASDFGQVFQAAIQRRLQNMGGWLTLWVLLGLVLGLIYQLVRSSTPESGDARPNRAFSLNSSQGFSLLLILIGTLLVLGPDFFFLRDQFGWRMNTIFKFYFQAWLLWGVAAAYACVLLLLRLRGIWDLLFRVGLVAIFAMGLVYPVFGLWNKTNGFKSAAGWTLDSSQYLANDNPNEHDAIRWLSEAPAGVVAEAVDYAGGSYTSYARAATFSGKPAVLGWMGHESQWRGGGDAMGTRQADLATLYCTRDWDEAEEILLRYQIRYIFLGSLERQTYQAGSGGCDSGLNENKFDRFLTPVFHQGDVTIYETPLYALSER